MMAVKARQIPALQLLLGKHRLLVNEQDHVSDPQNTITNNLSLILLSIGREHCSDESRAAKLFRCGVFPPATSLHRCESEERGKGTKHSPLRFDIFALCWVQRDETALMMAAAGGYSTIVEWLLEKEAHSTSTNAVSESHLILRSYLTITLTHCMLLG